MKIHMKKFLALLFLSASLFANPSGPTIIRGDVHISSMDKQLQIQSSDGTIIHWDGFSIAQDEITRFIQPSIDSSVLNRVTGPLSSEILGRLISNGQVLLLNPNGILIGKSAQIDTAGFLASTLNLTDEDFLQKRDWIFRGDSQECIENLGTIQTSNGDITLLAHIVKNNGTLTPQSGAVNIGAGCEILLQPDSSEKIFIRPSLQGDWIENKGVISALQTEIKADGSPYAKAIRLDGQISVANLVSKDGKILISSGSADMEIGGSLASPSGQMEISAASLTIEKKASLSALQGEISLSVHDLHNEGTVSSAEGSLQLKCDSIVHTGVLDVSGDRAGTIRIDTQNFLNGGKIVADNSLGTGGLIFIYASEGIIETAAAQLSANGNRGGQITSEVGKDHRLFTSGSYEALGKKYGGSIHLLGPDLCLVAAKVNANGQEGGGTILIGGDFQGSNPAIINAKTLYVSGNTTIQADALDRGNGGKIILWSDEKSEIYGSISCQGGSTFGDGGFVELSAKVQLNCPGKITNGAPNGSAGTLLLDPTNIVIDNATGIYPQYQFIDPNPAGGGNFGANIVSLSTGNVAVTNPGENTGKGAVYLFNGKTAALLGALIGSQNSDQVGSGNVTALPNGNYVVSSPDRANGANAQAGAATFCKSDGSTVGTVSATNSLVGSSAGDFVGNGGITVLSNGNYVVDSSDWSGARGAVTLCKSDGSTVGTVSATNSLVGSSGGDFVGDNGVTVLSNGNYVVDSSGWSGNIGAVTFCKSDGSTVGAVSATNSLVGSSAGDLLGGDGVTVLSNGNYVVDSSNWSALKGAVTLCKSDGSTVGTVSIANSLVGSSAGDQVGSHKVTVLSNGNYVVASGFWSGNTGAATFCKNDGSTVGTVSATNSLVGSSAGDFVGVDGVTVLSNGNYVVCSHGWSSNRGAATLCASNGSTTGAIISATNSLVGSSAGDLVGYGRATALPNGNYIVNSQRWSGNIGAVTFCKNDGSTVGTVSIANSLVGSTAGDSVGSGGVVVASNGNYIVDSRTWSGNIGAVTFCKNDGSTVGTVSIANSLVGSTAGDSVGSGGVVVADG